MPVFARPNSVVATGARDDRPDYEFNTDVTLNLFEIADGAHIVTTVPTTSGERAATFTTTRVGSDVVVRKTGQPAAWHVVCAGREFAMSDGETECRFDLG
jgi:alpha-D-xyloside xylohydrolase